MRMKSIVKYVLLLFIALSIGFLVLSGGEEQEQQIAVNNNQKVIQQEKINPKASNETNQVVPETDVKPASENPGKVIAPPPDEKPKTLQKTKDEKENLILAYYFHGNYRCHTCRTIEALAYKTISDRFAVELHAGEIIWKEINVEQPENRHFVDEFQLYSSSLVLVKKEGEKTLDWKILQEVWQLVRDENKFAEYIAKEIKAFKEKRI